MILDQILAHKADELAARRSIIPIEQLRYWSAERQEAYASAEASAKAEQRA